MRTLWIVLIVLLLLITASVLVIFFINKANAENIHDALDLQDNSSNYSDSEKIELEEDNQRSKICTNESFVLDNNIKYIKTVCYVNDIFYKPQTYRGAYDICKNNRMKLYQFDSKDSYEGFLKLANRIWPPYFGAAVWVNGEREQTCSGDFKIKDRMFEKDLYDDISYEALGNCGDCMKVWNAHGAFRALPESCDTKMTFFCEYH